MLSTCFFLLFVSLFLTNPSQTYAEEQQVVISELYPNPPGDDLNAEWIELHNVGTEAVSLAGWTLRDTDGSIKTYTFTSQSIEVGSYLVIQKTDSGITLNNDHDGVVFTSPEGLASQTRYDQAIPEDVSWSLLQGVWKEASPTQGFQNEQPNVSPNPSPMSLTSPTPPPNIPSPSPSPSLLPTPSSFLSPTNRPSLSEVKACGSEGEWVELYNSSDSIVNLDDWSLGDLRSSVKTLNGFTMLPRQYLSIDFPYAVLNNNGDDVRLLFDGEAVEQFSYVTCQSNTSWVKANGVWIETNCPTKGSTNNPCDEIERNTTEVNTSPSPSPTMKVSQKLETPVSITIPKPSPSYTLPSLVQTWSSEVVVATVSSNKQSVPITHSPQPQKQGYTGESFLIGGGCFLLSCSVLLSRMLQS